MRFRTEMQFDKQRNTIDHQSKIALFGSCFTEHIDKKLRHFGFDTFSNSHGILFHPQVIENALSDCLSEKSYTIDDLILFDELWLSLNHHGIFSQPDPEAALSEINQRILKGRKFLREASHLILTLGTAWIYRHLEQNQYVANCHKIPQKEFRKELLGPEEIAGSLKRIVDSIKSENKDVEIILTLSPVRHLKDGFVENTRSKGILHQAIHTIVDSGAASYFPSYEIMMDDLRDYRFYENDLIHPNTLAVEYIWEKFSQNWLSDETIDVMKEVGRIHKSMEHTPFYPDSDKHKEFERNLEKRIRELRMKYPEIRINKKGGL